MQSIATLINQEICKLIEKLHEGFPHTSSRKMLSIWCELQQIDGLPEEEEQKVLDEETLAKLEKGTLMESILNLISQEIWKFAAKLHEEFPGISTEELLSMWCELQQICGFEFPEREKQLSLDDETTAEKVLPTGENKEEEHNTKTCQPMYMKGRKANTQCKVRVKGDTEFCSRHKPKS